MLTFSESEAALRTGSVVVATSRDVVVATGPDAASYLHGQMSQNIERLEVGESAWSLLLEPNGRVTAWTRVTRVADDEYWLDVDAGWGADMLARLERFKLRTKATFELHVDVTTAAVRGPASPSVADAAAALGHEAAAPGAPGMAVAALEWLTSSGVDILGTTAERAAELLDLPVADVAVAELERIEAGRPAMGREFGEKTIPAETGVVERSADFTKGCYVGQELVARVDSRGNNTPRTVHPATIRTAIAPPPGTEMTLGDEVVGTVTSAASAGNHVAALVSLKRGVDVPCSASIDLDGDRVEVEVREVDWA